MSRYVELLGLPGSGKSAVVRSFSSDVRDRSEKLVPLPAKGNVAALLGLRRSPLLALPEVSRLRTIVRRLIFDGVGMEAQAQYPGVYEKILGIFADGLVDPNLVNESLNYWKVRLIEHSSIIQNHKIPVAITDEGVSQAVFSTLMRLSDEYRTNVLKEERLAQLIRVLPAPRTTIWLDTPLEIALSRCREGKRNVPEQTSSAGRFCLQKIGELTASAGGSFFTVDGSLSVSEIRRNIHELLETHLKRTS